MSNRETIKIGSPLSSFGNVLVAEKTPIVQLVSTYGINDRVDTNTVTSGTVGKDTGGFFASTGTTSGASAYVRSHRHASYHAGQGIEGAFTARFTTGVANSTQRAGLFTSTDSVQFGYNGTSFGVLHKHSGINEVQTLTVTTPASGSENATVTVDGTGYTVALTSGTVQHNAHEIAVSLNSQVSGWSFSQNDDDVISISLDDGDKVGSFAFSSSTAIGSWVETIAGVVATEDWTAQSAWNRKTLLAGTTDDPLDPAMGNVYKVDYQYLGYGFIVFWVETVDAMGFEAVHVVEFPNSNTISNFANPTMHIGWESSSVSSTTDLTVHGSSGAIFIHGKNIILGDTRGKTNTKAIANADSEVNLFTLRSRRVFGGVENKAELVPYLLTVASEGNKNSIFRLRRNATFADNTDYSFIDSTNSITEVDTSASTVTSTGEPLLTIGVAPGESADINLREVLDIFLAHDDTLTISCEHSGASSDMNATITWKEDL